MSEKTKEIIKWLEKADHDLGTAIITQKHLPDYRDTIAFHCQQAVEKYLKAYLINLDLKIIQTHDLVYLLELIDSQEKIEKIWFGKCAVMQDFAVEFRYPDKVIELSNNEIELAIQTAKEIREMIISKIGIPYPLNLG
jgi:HEPN domain-containing protein